MKKNVGKPYEGKLHVRFDEEGQASLLLTLPSKLALRRGAANGKLGGIQDCKVECLLRHAALLSAHYTA